MLRSYEELKAELMRLRREGKVNVRLTAEERADWAYGNTKIENDDVTPEMAQSAVEKKPR